MSGRGTRDGNRNDNLCEHSRFHHFVPVAFKILQRIVMQFTYGQTGLGRKAVDRVRLEFAGLSGREKHLLARALSR